METPHHSPYRVEEYMFKSYYVVWKRGKHLCDVLRGVGLNRTMQYGNLKGIKKKKRISPSLNRTMQYGNEKMEYIIGEGTPSLNRTMQYGNDRTAAFRAATHRV